MLQILRARRRMHRWPSFPFVRVCAVGLRWSYIFPLTHVTILSIIPSPVLLTRHFFAVALYSIWALFTHPRPRPVYRSPSSEPENKLESLPRAPGFDEYPALAARSVAVVRRLIYSLFALPRLFVSVLTNCVRLPAVASC